MIPFFVFLSTLVAIKKLDVCTIDDGGVKDEIAPGPPAVAGLTVRYPFPADAKAARQLLNVDELGTRLTSKIARDIVLLFTHENEVIV